MFFCTKCYIEKGGKMKLIFNKVFIHNNEVLFYVYLAIIILIILFALYATVKEIKNEHR